MPYSVGFKDKMVAKMLGPDGQTATQLSTRTGVSQPTLSKWLREAKLRAMEPGDKKPKAGAKSKRWTPEGKLRVVREAMGMDEVSLGALLRREGLHKADLDRFREEMLEAAMTGIQAARKPRKGGQSAEQRRIKELEKELKRKDKALAEAAALLVLRKKMAALFPEEEGESTDENND